MPFGFSSDQCYLTTLVVANALSVVSAACVVIKSLQLPHALRRRSLPRLMLLSATTDILFHCFFVAVHWAHSSLYLMTLFTFVLSLFLELAICVAFLLRSWHRVNRVSAWLPLIALTVAAVTVISVAITLASLRDLSRGSEVIRKIHGGLLALTSSLSCLCLGITAARARACGDAAKRRCLMLSAAFAVNALVTELPTAILDLFVLRGPSIFVQARPSVPFWLAVGDTLVSLSGLANACTFFVQSRYSRGRILSIAHVGKVTSFDVRWSEPEVLTASIVEEDVVAKV